MTELIPPSAGDDGIEKDLRTATPANDACISERLAIAAALEVAIAFDRVPFLVAMLNCSALPASQMADLIFTAGRPARPRLELVSLADRMAAENIPNVSADDGARPAKSAGPVQTTAREAQPAKPRNPRILRANSRLLPPEH